MGRECGESNTTEVLFREGKSQILHGDAWISQLLVQYELSPLVVFVIWLHVTLAAAGSTAVMMSFNGKKDLLKEGTLRGKTVSLAHHGTSFLKTMIKPRKQDISGAATLIYSKFFIAIIAGFF